MNVLDHVLASPAARPWADVHAWFAHLATCPYAAPIERAIWAGAAADRLGYAFAGGYEAALGRLLGVEGPVALSLAVTEAGGGHPKTIATRFENGVLHGEKTFATLASAADAILVVAVAGAAGERKRFVVARIRKDAPGLTLVDRALTAFAPEIPHAKLTLEGVPVDDVLPGDGWETYVKPFRTVEDTHVLAASLAYLVAAGQTHGFDHALVEDAYALVVALHGLAACLPSDPKVHIALSGVFRAGRKLIAEHDAEWEKAPAEVRDRWRRDLPLLVIAEGVRQKRTALAWDAVSPPRT